MTSLDNSKALLSDTASGLSVKKFPKGTVLFRQGEKGIAAYVVGIGAVSLYREEGDQKVPLAIVRQGGLFGEMSVIDGSPRMATTVVTEDCTLTIISAEAVAEKMKSADAFLKVLVQMLMKNLRNVHNIYTPKPRTMVDVANAMNSQTSVIRGLLENKAPGPLRDKLTEELKSVESRIGMIRMLASDLQDVEPRKNTIPGDAEY